MFIGSNCQCLALLPEVQPGPLMPDHRQIARLVSGSILKFLPLMGKSKTMLYRLHLQVFAEPLSDRGAPDTTSSNHDIGLKNAFIVARQGIYNTHSSDRSVVDLKICNLGITMECRSVRNGTLCLCSDCPNRVHCPISWVMQRPHEFTSIQ